MNHFYEGYPWRKNPLRALYLRWIRSNLFPAFTLLLYQGNCNHSDIPFRNILCCTERENDRGIPVRIKV